MRKLLTVSVALAGLAGGYVWMSSSERAVSSEHDSNLVRDRVWIDHMPRGEKDKINVFIALSQRPRQPPLGIFEQVSMWEGHFEAFTYEQHGEEWRIVLPQSGDRETLTIKASRCSEAGMDFCLEVKGASRGPTRYYSRKGWEVRSREQAEALSTQLLAK